MLKKFAHLFYLCLVVSLLTCSLVTSVVVGVGAAEGEASAEHVDGFEPASEAALRSLAAPQGQSHSCKPWLACGL